MGQHRVFSYVESVPIFRPLILGMALIDYHRGREIEGWVFGLIVLTVLQLALFSITRRIEEEEKK